MRRNRNVVTTYSSSDDDGSDSNEDAKSDWVSVQLSELSSMQFSDFAHDGYYSDSFLEECEAETGVDDYESYMAGTLDVEERIAREGVVVPASFAVAFLVAAPADGIATATTTPTNAANPETEEEAAMKRKKEVQSLVMRGHLKAVKRPDTYASTMRHPDAAHPHGKTNEEDAMDEGNESFPSDRRVGEKSKREEEKEVDDAEEAAGAVGGLVKGASPSTTSTTTIEAAHEKPRGSKDGGIASPSANVEEPGTEAVQQGRRRSSHLQMEDLDYESSEGALSSPSGPSGVSSKKARRSRIDAQVVDMDDVGRPPLGRPPLVHGNKPQNPAENAHLPFNPRQTLTVVRGLYNTSGIGGGMGPSATPKLTSSMATSRGSTVTSYRTPIVVRRELHVLTGSTPLTQDNSVADAHQSAESYVLPDSESYPLSGVADTSDMNVSHVSDVYSGNSSRTGENTNGDGHTTGRVSDTTPLYQQQASHSLTASNVQVYHALSPDESEQSDAVSILSQSTRLTTTVEVTVHASNAGNPSEMFSEMRPPSRRYSMQPRQKRNSSLVTSTVNEFLRLVNRTSGNTAGDASKAHDSHSGLPPRKGSGNRARQGSPPTSSNLDGSRKHKKGGDSVDASTEEDDDDDAGELGEEYERDDVIEAMDMPPKPSTSSPHPPSGSRGKLGSGSRTAASKASTRRRVSARPFLEDAATTSMKTSHASLLNQEGSESVLSDPLQSPLNSSTYRANTYRRASKGSVEATVVDDDGGVPTKNSPLSPNKSRTSLQGANTSTSKRPSQLYRLPAVKYLSGAAGGATAHTSGEFLSDTERRVSKSLSPRGSVRAEDKGGQLKDTKSTDALKRLSDRATSGGAGAVQSRFSSVTNTNRTAFTPQDMDRNESLSSIPFKSGRLSPIPSPSPFDEGLGAHPHNSKHALHSEETAAYPQFATTGNAGVDGKQTETHIRSTSLRSVSSGSKDTHGELGVSRRTTLRPINAKDGSGTVSRSSESSRSATVTRSGQPSNSSARAASPRPNGESKESLVKKRDSSQDSKTVHSHQAKDDEQLSSVSHRSTGKDGATAGDKAPIQSLLPQLMPLQEDSGRRRRKASDPQDASTSLHARTDSRAAAADSPSAANPTMKLQSERSSETELRGDGAPRKVSSTGRILRKLSSHRQKTLISEVKFDDSRDAATPSPTLDSETTNAVKLPALSESVKQDISEKEKKNTSEKMSSKRIKRGGSASPLSPEPRDDGSSFPRVPDAGADTDDVKSPQGNSTSQRGVWPDCAPPVVGSYEYGGPTVSGAATPVLPDGMLFMVISASNEYAFYNDTLTHTFYVTFKFTSRTTPIPEGVVSGKAAVSSLRTQNSREVRESKQELFSEVKPGDTVVLFKGLLLNPKVEVSFSTVQRNYVPRPVAENGSMISAAIARMKSKMGSWNKRVSEESLVRCCVKNRVPFIDVHFRPSHRSLCRVGFDEVYVPPLMWMTPQQFLPECFKLTGQKRKPVRRLFPAQDVGLSLDGACKGSIDDGGLVGAIVASAEYVDHVHWMFRHPKSVEKGKAERRVGVYRVVLCVNGWWSTYIIDEYLPASRRGPLLAYFGPDLQCQWVSLMEKAYAKALGSYAQICFGDFDEHLRDVFGYPVRSITPVIQRELKALKERTEQEGKDAHDAHSDLFSYLGQCTRRNLLCVLFTPYSYAGDDNDDSVTDASRTDDIMSASSSATRRSTVPWQSRGSVNDRSPNQPYWMRGSVSTEEAPNAKSSPPPASRQASQIPANAVLIEVRSATDDSNAERAMQTPPTRSAQNEAGGTGTVFGAKEPVSGTETAEKRPSTTTSSHTHASGDTDTTTDKMPRMERPRNRARSQLQQSAQLLIGESSAVEEEEARKHNHIGTSVSTAAGEKIEGVHFTEGTDDNDRKRDKGKSGEGGKSITLAGSSTSSPIGKNHVGGLGYGSRLTQRREWSDEELQRIFPPDHPFIVKATLFSRELKQRMVGIKNPWKASSRMANSSTVDGGAADPSAATSPSGIGKSEAQLPVVDVGASPTAGSGGLRRTLSVGPKSGTSTSRFTQSFSSGSVLRNSDLGSPPGSADGAGRTSSSSLILTTGQSNGSQSDAASSPKGKQQESEDDLIWIPWSSALRLFCGGSVTYCLKNWCQYRVYGEFENGCSSLALRLDVSCSVDIMVTLYQEDLRLIATDVDVKSGAGRGAQGRSHRAHETAMRMVERRAGYLPILLAMSSSSTSSTITATTTAAAGGKGSAKPTSIRSGKQQIAAKSTDDMEAPSLGPTGSSGGGAEMQHETPTGKEAWMFLKERTVTLKMTLVPESGPYYIIPHIHEEIAYDRCRPFSLELLSDQPINTLDSTKHEGNTGNPSAAQKGSNVRCRFFSVPHSNPCFSLASSFEIRIPEDEESVGSEGKNAKTVDSTENVVAGAGGKRKTHTTDASVVDFMDPTLAKPIETSYQVKTFKGFEEKEGDAIVDVNACAAA